MAVADVTDKFPNGFSGAYRQAQRLGQIDIAPAAHRNHVVHPLPQVVTPQQRCGLIAQIDGGVRQTAIKYQRLDAHRPGGIHILTDPRRLRREKFIRHQHAMTPTQFPHQLGQLGPCAATYDQA